MRYLLKSFEVEAIRVETVLKCLEDNDWSGLPLWFRLAFKAGRIKLHANSIEITDPSEISSVVASQMAFRPEWIISGPQGLFRLDSATFFANYEVKPTCDDVQEIDPMSEKVRRMKEDLAIARAHDESCAALHKVQETTGPRCDLRTAQKLSGDCEIGYATRGVVNTQTEENFATIAAVRDLRLKALSTKLQEKEFEARLKRFEAETGACVLKVVHPGSDGNYGMSVYPAH